MKVQPFPSGCLPRFLDAEAFLTAVSVSGLEIFTGLSEAIDGDGSRVIWWYKPLGVLDVPPFVPPQRLGFQ